MVKLFKKETPVDTPTRVKRLSDTELLDIMSTSIMQLGAAFDSMRYRQAPPELVAEAVDTVNLLWVEYSSRNQ